MTWFFPCKFLNFSYLDMQKISINGADRFWQREPPYFALFNVVVLVVWHFHLICLTPFQMSPVPSLHNELKAFLNFTRHFSTILSIYQWFQDEYKNSRRNICWFKIFWKIRCDFNNSLTSCSTMAACPCAKFIFRHFCSSFSRYLYCVL